MISDSVRQIRERSAWSIATAARCQAIGGSDRICVCMRSSSVSYAVPCSTAMAIGASPRATCARAVCCSSCSSSAIRRPSWSSARSSRLAPLSFPAPAAALCIVGLLQLLICVSVSGEGFITYSRARSDSAQASFPTSSERYQRPGAAVPPGVRRGRRWRP